MRGRGAAVFGLVALASGCALWPTRLSNEERAAACKFAPASRECAEGLSFQPERVHAIIVRLDEQRAAEAREHQTQADAAEQQARAEAHARKVASPRYIHRHEETFASYQDALDVLDPEEVGPGVLRLMSLKGRPILLLSKVDQVIGKTAALVDPCLRIEDAPFFADSCPVYADIFPGVGGRRQLVDGETIMIVGEVYGMKP